MSEADDPIPDCPACGYDLAGLVSARCPECGCDVVSEEIRRGRPKPVFGFVIALILGSIGWFLGSIVLMAVSRTYAKRAFTGDPIEMIVHGMAIAVPLLLVAVIVCRRRIRLSTRRAYTAISVASYGQLAACLFAWATAG